MVHIYKVAEGYTHWLSYQGLPLTKVVTGETTAYMLKEGKEGDGESLPATNLVKQLRISAWTHKTVGTMYVEPHVYYFNQDSISHYILQLSFYH